MDGLMYLDATVLAVAALTLSLITLIVTISLSMRQRKLLKRYRRLLSGNLTPDLEDMLLSQGTTLEQLDSDITGLKGQVAAVVEQTKLHTQKTAIVRFNAFPDTGSDLSFAIALLDAHNNGMVISSLYSRNESRVYAKPILNGKSTYALSDEEKQVIAKATGEPL